MKKKTAREFVCPFCSLLCDDISITDENNRFRVQNLKNKTCLKKIESFNTTKKSILLPKINGKNGTLTNAINKSKLLINRSNEIGILNSGADMDSIRSAINLSSQTGANFDHINSKYFFDNMNIVQRSGYVATTLMELKNRSDTILIFGDKVIQKSPRLFEKYIFPDSALFSKANKRKVFLIGKFSENEIKILKNKSQITNIKLDLKLIPKLLQIISSQENGEKIKISKKVLDEIKLTMKKSKYISAIWSSSDFYKTGFSGSIVKSITKFICDLNSYTRAVCLPIAGNLGDPTSAQVSTWLTGFPTRFKSINGLFQHDREAHDVLKLINNNEIDLVIHINCLSSEKIYINKKIKNIVIGHPDTSFSSTPDIFIPVGIPGIDYKGIMYRTDNVVSMALKNVRKINLPSPKQVLDKLI